MVSLWFWSYWFSCGTCGVRLAVLEQHNSLSFSILTKWLHGQTLYSTQDTHCSFFLSILMQCVTDFFVFFSVGGDKWNAIVDDNGKEKVLWKTLTKILGKRERSCHCATIYQWSSLTYESVDKYPSHPVTMIRIFSLFPINSNHQRPRFLRSLLEGGRGALWTLLLSSAYLKHLSVTNYVMCLMPNVDRQLSRDTCFI